MQTEVKVIKYGIIGNFYGTEIIAHQMNLSPSVSNSLPLPPQTHLHILSQNIKHT